ncbi:hypothetical protein [Liquorilactobacillus sicerae]|uniref:hypothetical protein n=1 Tax=Liquorilactobacillus sicerae TaxID=1416943 RepID=UPI002480AE3D|nr:hypothetical protein [Liquorilactobacillus sicerae]
MLSIRKTCALFFKEALQEYRLFLIIGSGITILWPFIVLIRFGTSQNDLIGIGGGELWLAVMFIFLGIIKLLGMINRVWTNSKYRLLPMSSTQLYLSNITMQILAFIVTIGFLAVINLLAGVLIFDTYAKISWSVNATSMGFSLSAASSGKVVVHISAEKMSKIILTLLDFFGSIIIDISFVLLLSESIMNWLTRKHQRIFSTLGFAILLALFLTLDIKIADQLTSDSVSFAYDLAVSVLSMLGSIYLLKHQVETRN